MEGDGGGGQSLSSMHFKAEREAAAATTAQQQQQGEDAPQEKKSPEKEIPQHPSERYTRVRLPFILPSSLFFLRALSLIRFTTVSRSDGRCEQDLHQDVLQCL